MTEFYDEAPLEYPSELPPLAEGEIRGNAWSVRRSGGSYVLCFISGALHGKELSVEISSDDYTGLRDGSLSITDVQRKYDVG